MTQQAPEEKSAPPLGEWLWRVLASVLLLALGGVAWIAYQINPSPLATPAAYQAAAQALATRNVQAGTIRSSPREPPVNIDKLRLSETLGTPVAEAPDATAQEAPVKETPAEK